MAGLGESMMAEQDSREGRVHRERRAATVKGGSKTTAGRSEQRALGRDDASPVLAELHASLDGVLAEYAEDLDTAGMTLDDIGGAATVEAAVRAVLPRPNRFVDRVGAVYTTGQLRRLLPGASAPLISDQAVRNRHAAGRLMGAKTRDERWVFPAFQFHIRPGRLEVRDEVLELWTLLPDPGRLDEWTLLAWMTGSRRDLDGLSPLDYLDGYGLDDTLAAAAGKVRRRASAA